MNDSFMSRVPSAAFRPRVGFLPTINDETRPQENGRMRTGGMLPPPNVQKSDPARVWNSLEEIGDE